jgi:LemA protein
MKPWHVLVALLAVVAIVFFGWINIRNKLVTAQEGTTAAWAQVESQLQRRYDLIPNLVETVKGYAKHENEVFTEVTKARASVGGATTPEQKIAANNQLTSALSRLLVVAEQYPELKANQNFLALQDELAGTENRISVERKRYNEIAQAYNTMRRKFPYSLMAEGFKEAAYFQAAEGAKEAPKVKF